MKALRGYAISKSPKVCGVVRQLHNFELKWKHEVRDVNGIDYFKSYAMFR